MEVGRRGWAAVLASAALLTAVDAVKPLVVDDTAYQSYASWISHHPADPYGFQVFWYQKPEPAYRVVVPPVFVYWLAGGMALLGDTPLLWKLWTFPFHLLLAASLLALLRRFARGLETPLLWMWLLSPVVLPCVSLMVDLPVTALGLASIACMLCAVSGAGAGAALLAGLCAGLALQTKYNGAVYLAAALASAGLARRWRLALLAGAVAGAIFLGWEGFVAWRYGESPFLTALLHPTPAQDPVKPVALWTLAFVSILGATAMGQALLALRAVAAPRWLFAGCLLLATALLVGVVPLLPAESVARVRSSVPMLDRPRPEIWLFVPLGLGVVAAVAAALRALLRSGNAAQHRLDLWLAVWLAIEVVCFYLVSPFPAVRRTLGLSVVTTLIAGRLLARREASLAWRRARPAVVWSVALGLLFCAADLSDALTRRRAVQDAAQRLEALGAGRERVWFTGHWGFQFYAERLGMKPVVPGRSELAPGDWLVMPDGVDHQRLRVYRRRVRLRDTLSARSPSPWSVLPASYHGPVPLRAQPDAQLVIRIYRVRAPFVPPGVTSSRKRAMRSR